MEIELIQKFQIGVATCRGLNGQRILAIGLNLGDGVKYLSLADARRLMQELSIDLRAIENSRKDGGND